MPNLNQQLLPCPFCGGTEIHESSNGHESHMLVCESCGAEGPADISDSKAAEAWNRRQHGSAAQAVACPVAIFVGYHDEAAVIDWIADGFPAGTELFAAPPVADTETIEKLAQSWDGCMYDAPGEMIDIGASIRAALSRLNEGTK